MDMSDKERDKIKKILDDKLKSLDKKKKKWINSMTSYLKD
jgi:uncharacterized protein (UPF0297 family)